MKKIVSMFAMAALALAITACGGNSGNQNNAGESTDAAATEAAAPAASAGNDVVAQYEKLIDKMIDLQKKVTGGDMSIMDEYTKLSQEMADFATKYANELENLTEAQTQRFAEIGQKWANAVGATMQ